MEVKHHVYLLLKASADPVLTRAITAAKNWRDKSVQNLATAMASRPTWKACSTNVSDQH